MNTLGALSRQGQWRFRHVFRGADERGRLDVSDAGLIDFSNCSEVALTVTPRPPYRGCGANGAGPVLAASLAGGTLFVSNPGLVEAVFPAGSLTDLCPGIYDARIFVTIGPETEEVFCEPVEFA
ncbi:hypothetical protein GU700_22655 [Methylobacterium sp. NI91]|nr:MULTISPECIES: hypothetical protein [unclassified Methylobacterium]QIJ77123.1 hypothetical protein CLZ_22660 [Methylobacterium sp. CLZ]QIJ82027.1 hypothetical protein GU700_22655 [Methylobacterium sp. NI91]